MADLYQQILFWILAVVIAFSALRVVTSSNVIHAALYLVGTLMGAAGLYILLLAEFVAWVQVLVYVGAVVVLMLFGLMLTRAPIGKGEFDNDQRPLAAICAVAVFGVAFFAGFLATGLATSGPIGACSYPDGIRNRMSRRSIDSAPRSPRSVALGVTSSSSTPSASTSTSCTLA